MTEEHHLQPHEHSPPPAQWTQPWELLLPIESTGICSGISAVAFNNKIHAFFVVDNIPGHLGLSYLVLGNNAENKLVVEKQEYLDARYLTRHRPAVTVHEGRLFCFYTGVDKTVHYHVFSGSSWTHGEQVPGVLTEHAPSVFSTNGKLHLAVQGLYNGEFYHKIFENFEWENTINTPGISFKGSPSLGGNGSLLYVALTGVDDSVVLFSFHSGSWQFLYTSPNYKVQGSPTIYFGRNLLMCASVNARDQRVVTEVLGMAWPDPAHPGGIQHLGVTLGKYLSEPCLIEYGEQLYLIGRRPCNDVGISLYKPQVIG